MSTTNPTRQNGSDAQTEWSPLPASWIARGDTTKPHATPAETYYATAARVEGGSVVVKFVQPRHERAVTKRYPAHHGAGGVVPKPVADHGPGAFNCLIGLYAGADHAGVTVTEQDRQTVADYYEGAGVRA